MSNIGFWIRFMKRRDEKMDIDNKKVELFEKFVEEIGAEVVDFNLDLKNLLALAFHAGFEKGFNLGYVTSVEEYEDGKADIPF